MPDTAPLNINNSAVLISAIKYFYTTHRLHSAHFVLLLRLEVLSFTNQFRGRVQLICRNRVCSCQLFYQNGQFNHEFKSNHE